MNIICALHPDRADLTETDAQELQATFDLIGLRAQVRTTETMELDVIVERDTDTGIAGHLLRKWGLDVL